MDITNLVDGATMDFIRETTPRDLIVDDIVIKENTDKKEEWIWVEGYKGTDADMRCRDEQYELGKRYDMPDESKIKECSCGYHLCLMLEDVFGHYPICRGNRFFKVRALVRADDVKYYDMTPRRKGKGRSKGRARISFDYMKDKLAAKSIEFIRELTVDEIFEHTMLSDWTTEQKTKALKTSVAEVEANIQVDILAEYGYSKPFAIYLIACGMFEVAKAVGSQEDLSMDMKCLMIFKEMQAMGMRSGGYDGSYLTKGFNMR